MTRFFAAAAAATLAFVPAAGIAQGTPNGYAATPVTAPAKASFVTRSTLWKCNAGTCIAPANGSTRDAIACELVAREVGKLSAFRANGADFDAAALEKCNTKAH
ncbi:hypothetical protein [Sphingomonas sp. KR3-1]|uniref:CC_3452 family protein n=1 Tax=Sphingomonas sp. KR3-1 TaxID=3156611 RepID=UPI0032B464AB